MSDLGDIGCAMLRSSSELVSIIEKRLAASRKAILRIILKLKFHVKLRLSASYG